jgi:sugar-specific transcriptional regulator TrmB
MKPTTEKDDDSYIQTLTKSGLTLLQAKAYLNLSKLKRATVKTIAAESKIARPDVYRVMVALEKTGLAQKIVANPVTYEATPIKDACSILMKSKRQEYRDLQKNISGLIMNFDEKNESIPFQETSSEQFFLISSKELFIKKCEIEDSIVQKSIDIIDSWGALRAYVFYHLQALVEATQRGVKIRIITEDNMDTQRKQKIYDNFGDTALFEMRFISSDVPVRAAIYDNKKANMCLMPPSDSEIVPNLWSENPQFVKVMASYFNHFWFTANRQ